MLNAPRVTPLVTADAPWLGASWHGLLRTLGIEGVTLAEMYFALALPTLGFLVLQAWNRKTPLFALMSSALLGTFAIAPYARYYDLPILVFPLLELLGRPIHQRVRTWLPVCCTLVPIAVWLVWPLDPPVIVAQLQWIWVVAALVGLRWWSSCDGPFMTISGPGENCENFTSRDLTLGRPDIGFQYGHNNARA
jgi:hypothetical protein